MSVLLVTGTYSTPVAETQRGTGEQADETRVLTLAPVSVLHIAAGVFAAFFLVEFVSHLSETLTRVALGLVFAFGLDPVVVRLQRRIACTRGIAVAIVGVIAVTVFALLVAFAGPSAVRQAEKSSRELPATVERLSTLPLVGNVLEEVDASQRIRDWAADLPTRINDNSITGLVQTLVGSLVAGFTVIFVGLAVLLDGESLVRRLGYLVPRSHRDAGAMAGRVFYRTIGAYFAGSLVVASMASMFVLTVGLALGVPLTPIAALWVLIVGFIPQIGGFLGASMFTLLGFGRGPGTALLCLVLYWMYMTFENHVIQPAVVGNAVNMSAPATMLAALIGGAAAGVPGAILATPVAGTVKAVYMEVHEPGSTVRKPRVGLISGAWKKLRARLGR